MTRACILVAALLAGCDSAPAACPLPTEVRRVADHRGEATRLTTHWVGDHAYYLVDHHDSPASLYVGPRCEEAPLVTRGARLSPARTHLDPADDDPTLACELDKFLRIDLRGEQLPALVYPEHDCRATPTPHGLLVQRAIGAGSGLYLYSAFPEPASAVLVDEHGSSAEVRGDTVYFRDDMHTVLGMDLATRATTALARPVRDWQISETHLLWRERVDAGPAPVHILDLAAGTQLQLGAIDEADGPTALASLWRFGPTAKLVLHTPSAEGLAIEAFTVAGEPVPLPAPGTLSQVLAGRGVISRVEGDPHEQYFFTRPGAYAAIALDLHLTPEDPSYDVPLFADDRLEFRRDDALWAAPLDGSPARLLVADIGDRSTWIDADHLLTLRDGALTTVEVASDQRRVHAKAVAAYTTPGELAIDGAHYVDADGVWYLPPAVLLASELRRRREPPSVPLAGP